MVPYALDSLGAPSGVSVGGPRKLKKNQRIFGIFASWNGLFCSDVKAGLEFTPIIGFDEILNRPRNIVNHPRPTGFVYWAFKQSGSALFGASLLKFVLFKMYNYLVNFRPVLLGAPLQCGALSARLCYVYIMFPATTAAPFCRKRGAPWNFDHCSPYIKFCYVLLSFLAVCHGIRDAPLGEKDWWVPESSLMG